MGAFYLFLFGLNLNQNKFGAGMFYFLLNLTINIEKYILTLLDILRRFWSKINFASVIIAIANYLTKKSHKYLIISIIKSPYYDSSWVWYKTKIDGKI